MMQKNLLSFVTTGDVNAMRQGETTYWPRYDEGGTGKTNVLIMNSTGLRVGADDLENERSLFWNKAFWY